MIYFSPGKYLPLIENRTLDKIYLLQTVTKKITTLSRYIALEETKKEMQETAMKLMLFGEKRAYLCLMFDIEKACKRPQKKEAI